MAAARGGQRGSRDCGSVCVQLVVQARGPAVRAASRTRRARRRRPDFVKHVTRTVLNYSSIYSYTVNPRAAAPGGRRARGRGRGETAARNWWLAAGLGRWQSMGVKLGLAFYGGEPDESATPRPPCLTLSRLRLAAGPACTHTDCMQSHCAQSDGCVVSAQASQAAARFSQTTILSSPGSSA